MWAKSSFVPVVGYLLNALHMQCRVEMSMPQMSPEIYIETNKQKFKVRIVSSIATPMACVIGWCYCSSMQLLLFFLYSKGRASY